MPSPPDESRAPSKRSEPQSGGLTALRGRQAVVLLVALGLFITVAVLRLLVGADGFSGMGWPDASAIQSLRIQRLGAGTVVGAALAVGGVLLQALLRNPLASPDLLGLSSGAGLGVMIAAYVGFRAGEGLAPSGWHLPAALLGAVVALGVVYGMAQRRWTLEPVTLILVGVIVSIIAGAVTSLLQHLLPDRGLAASRMLLGAISDDLSPVTIVFVGGLTLAAIIAASWLGPMLDAASMSDDEARSVGVPLGAMRVVLFLVSGALTAGSVVLAGVVGFVGLVCPHVVRMLSGPTHRSLVPGAAIAGAVMVVGADVLVRFIELDTGRLPIGVLTALIGGPVLIWLLRAQGRGNGWS